MTTNAWIAKVPVELLGDIFLHVVSHPTKGVFDQDVELSNGRVEESRVPHVPVYESCASPYAISHVCRHWREIALSSSNLWTHLRVIIPTHQKVLPLLSLWIERAQRRSLSLAIQEVDATNDNHPATASREIFNLFFSTIERWKCLDLDLQTPLEDFISSSALSALTVPSLLESIRIFTPANRVLQTNTNQRFHGGTSPATSILASILHQSPHLRSATWTNAAFLDCIEAANLLAAADTSSFTSSSSPPFWGDSLGELTICDIAREDIRMLLKSLSGCPELERLYIRCHQRNDAYERAVYLSAASNSGPSSSYALSSSWDLFHDQSLQLDSYQESRVILPRLDTLFLESFDDGEDLPWIFDALDLPSLKTLHLRDFTDSDSYTKKRWSRLSPSTWSSLSAMLQRSDVTLRELVVGDVELSDSLCEDGDIWQPYWQ